MISVSNGRPRATAVTLFRRSTYLNSKELATKGEAAGPGVDIITPVSVTRSPFREGRWCEVLCCTPAP